MKCSIAAIGIVLSLLVTAGMIALVICTGNPAHDVKPFTYTATVTHNGQRMTCTMDVDSTGNGSLNDCQLAS